MVCTEVIDPFSFELSRSCSTFTSEKPSVHSHPHSAPGRGWYSVRSWPERSGTCCRQKRISLCWSSRKCSAAAVALMPISERCTGFFHLRKTWRCFPADHFARVPQLHGPPTYALADSGENERAAATFAVLFMSSWFVTVLPTCTTDDTDFAAFHRTALESL